MKSEQFRKAWPAMFAMMAMMCTGCTGVAVTSVPQASAAELDEEFKSCVRKEAPIAVDETIKKSGKNGLYGYHVGEFNAVISKCTGVKANYSVTFLSTLELMDESKFDKRSVYTKHMIDSEIKAKIDAFVKEEVAEQHKKDEENERRSAEAEKVLKGVGAVYVKCLFKHADILAKTSLESADVLSVAIFASCPTEKNNLRNAYLQRYHYFDDDGFMQAFDKHMQPDIIFRIVAIRAASLVPAEPVREKPSNNSDQL